MFKKTKIAAATVALLSAAAMQNASAVAFDDSGNSAQVLIFPYYNTNSGFATGFNIRNTKNETKAVKLRFRESKMSNDVLDFNVYMSPYDHFSVGLSVDKDDHAVLITQDKTCTYPAIPAEGVVLKGNVYKNTKFEDAREGYLEVIEMGVVDPAAVLVKDVGAAGNPKLVDYIKHTAGVPKDCTAIKTAWTDGTFTEGGANALVHKTAGDAGVNHETVVPKNILTPTGGLQGWSFLLDFKDGDSNVAMPTAIRNYQTTHGQHYVSDNVHTFLLPSLASGNVAQTHVMDNSGTALAVTPPWPTAVDYVTTTAGKAEVAPAVAGASPDASGVNPYPIAHLLAAKALTNDYLVSDTGSAAGDLANGTDWVVTFPMRKHGIFAYSKFAADGTGVEGDVTIDSAAFYNREEEKVSIDAGFSPVSSPAEQLLREVNVLSFIKTGVANTEERHVLRSKYTKPFGVDYKDGWGTIGFATGNGVDINYVDPTTGLNIKPTGYVAAESITTGFTNVVGQNNVPVIGFAAVRGNYKEGPANIIGESIPHTFLRDRTVVAQ